MQLEITTKKQLAIDSGMARSMLYYKHKMPERDWQIKIQIENTLNTHPSYGHKRISQVLGMNKKKVLRVMNLFGIKPYRRRPEKPNKSKDLGAEAAKYQNLLLTISFPERPGIAWVSDFTYIKFHGKFIYLATIMNLFNREIVGWSVLNTHTAQLTVTALIDALQKYQAPELIHSDQGSEYRSKVYITFVESTGIRISMSRKASPWENGYQESFYSQFKLDFGDPGRFKTIAELTIAIHYQIYYYNNYRIQSKLKMPPRQYAKEALQLTH